MFKSLKSGLAKVFANQRIDQNTIQDFEDLLITSDVDVETSELIASKLANEKFSNDPSLEEVQSSLSKIINEIVSTNIKTIDLSLIHISEPTRQAEISYAVFCLKKKCSVGCC